MVSPSERRVIWHVENLRRAVVAGNLDEAVQLMWADRQLMRSDLIEIAHSLTGVQRWQMKTRYKARCMIETFGQLFDQRREQ